MLDISGQASILCPTIPHEKQIKGRPSYTTRWTCPPILNLDMRGLLRSTWIHTLAKRLCPPLSMLTSILRRFPSLLPIRFKSLAQTAIVEMLASDGLNPGSKCLIEMKCGPKNQGRPFKALAKSVASENFTIK